MFSKIELKVSIRNWLCDLHSMFAPIKWINLITYLQTAHIYSFLLKSGTHIHCGNEIKWKMFVHRLKRKYEILWIRTHIIIVPWTNFGMKREKDIWYARSRNSYESFYFVLMPHKIDLLKHFQQFSLIAVQTRSLPNSIENCSKFSCFRMIQMKDLNRFRGGDGMRRIAKRLFVPQQCLSDKRKHSRNFILKISKITFSILFYLAFSAFLAFSHIKKFEY